MDRLIELERMVARMVDAIEDYAGHNTPPAFDRLEQLKNEARKLLKGN